MLWFLFGYTESVGMPFMNLHFWGLQTEELAYFGIVSLLGLPVAFALVPWITQTFDKRNTMIGSSLVYLILPKYCLPALAGGALVSGQQLAVDLVHHAGSCAGFKRRLRHNCSGDLQFDLCGPVRRPRVSDTSTTGGRDLRRAVVFR